MRRATAAPAHRVFAAMYDRMFAGIERGGFRELRAELVAQASGRTLELGAGTGLNLAHYSSGVSELVLTEPDPFMARRLRAKLLVDSPSELTVEVLEAGAAQLPVEDASVDTVVSTLVLCTVPDPVASIVEVARVPRPGARLLFLEHVRAADGSRTARWQDRLERPWGFFAAGCHPNRDTAALLSSSRLEIETLEHTTMPRAAGPMIRPLIRGTAQRPKIEAGGRT